ncbi:MAG: hypothetical protein AB8B91_11865 [Rubripirellula sp.]
MRAKCDWRSRHLVVAVLALLCVPAFGEDPVFSGPQVGEPLPSFDCEGLRNEREDETFDFVAEAEGSPLMIIFFHERTRPAFALMRTVSRWAAQQHRKAKKDVKQIHVAVVFLSDDMTETKKWATNVNQHLVDDVVYAVSPDGPEGPGAYGLNRNVTLTILVGNEGKVTENFALVQPQTQADGPKILNAIGEVTGNKEVPTIEQLTQQDQMGRMRAAKKDDAPARDPKLGTMIRAMIQKDATDAAVSEKAAEVEKYVTENAAARTQLARMTSTIVKSGKLSNYGTKQAQKVIQAWAKKYGKPAK